MREAQTEQHLRYYTDLECSLFVQCCLWLRRKDRGRRTAELQLAEGELWRTKMETNRWEKVSKSCHEVTMHEADSLPFPQVIFSIHDLSCRVEWWILKEVENLTAGNIVVGQKISFLPGARCLSVTQKCGSGCCPLRNQWFEWTVASVLLRQRGERDRGLEGVGWDDFHAKVSTNSAVMSLSARCKLYEEGCPHQPSFTGRSE